MRFQKTYTFRVYRANCLNCGAFLLEHEAMQDISLCCPECRGVNVFRNSTEPVEYLAPRPSQEFVLGNRTCTDKQTVIAESPLAQSASY